MFTRNIPYRKPAVFIIFALLQMMPYCGFSHFSAEGDAAGLGSAIRATHTLSVSDEIPSSTPAPTIDDLRSRVAQIPGISGVIVYQSGEIRYEQYWRGHRRDRPMNIKSASKSVLSALVGLALAEGHIKSLDDPISTYLPAAYNAIPADRLTHTLSDGSVVSKREITVRHLLTMSSGLSSTSFGSYGRWVLSPNWVQFVLNSELEAAPGVRMQYSTGDTHLLAAVLAAATRTSVRAYADRALMRPLGARIGGWDTDPQGIHFGGNNLALSPAALLAFGRLYLDGGRWNGEQLLDPQWVRDSLTPHFLQTSFNPRGHNYGYLWWNNTFGGHNAWFAWGYGGQYVFVLPELHAVVVLTGNPDGRTRSANGAIYETMDTHIVPYLKE
jgi:CubicO group peptidase (beta-lactamase class C family)